MNPYLSGAQNPILSVDLNQGELVNSIFSRSPRSSRGSDSKRIVLLEFDEAGQLSVFQLSLGWRNHHRIDDLQPAIDEALGRAQMPAVEQITADVELVMSRNMPVELDVDNDPRVKEIRMSEPGDVTSAWAEHAQQDLREQLTVLSEKLSVESTSVLAALNSDHTFQPENVVVENVEVRLSGTWITSIICNPDWIAKVSDQEIQRQVFAQATAGSETVQPPMTSANSVAEIQEQIRSLGSIESLFRGTGMIQ